MDSLQIMITNDRTGGERTRNYYYEVKVDRKIVIEGVIKGIPRIENWIEQLRELMVGSSGINEKVLAPAQNYTHPPVPLKKQQDSYLNEKEASEVTGISLSTLRNNRSTLRGIPYIKIGRSVRYKYSEIIAFMDGHKIIPHK